MVKADPKRDYYADLELPPTADVEDIKRQFRQLAKQYHPDRNPGREVDVVPKFQAVQAAHEILNDPQEKAKYDAARARMVRVNNVTSGYDTDPYNFRRPAAPRNTTAAPSFPFPPPPKQKPRPKSSAFATAGSNAQPSAGAEKFNAFTRNAQQWDRARFEDAKSEAARAEAARVFPNMRPAQAPPPQPPRPVRPHPTATKTTPVGPSPEPQHIPNGVPPIFAGMSRTASARKPGFAPGTPGGDEPPASRSASYANFPRTDRAQASTKHTNASDPYGYQSPPLSKVRPPPSNLRHTRSSDHDMRPGRPRFERTSSKYASASGERTDINSPAISRSASLRNSPVEPPWADQGAFGRPQSHQGPSHGRHHSASPKVNPADFSSDSSTSDDEPLTMGSRRKAVPRRPRANVNNISREPTHRVFSDDDPALTGQFPKTNYTRVVEESQYHYPPPQARDGPTRRPFPDLTTPAEDFKLPMNGSGYRYVHGDSMEGQNRSTHERSSNHDKPSDRENTNGNFSAADWDGKFTNAEDFLGPNDFQARKSPSKTHRPGNRAATRSRGMSRSQEHDFLSPDDILDQSSFERRASPNTEHTYSQDSTFHSAHYSEEDWAKNLHTAKHHSSNDAMRSKPTKRSSRANSTRKPDTVSNADDDLQHQTSNTEDFVDAQADFGSDAMDIDETILPRSPQPQNAQQEEPLPHQAPRKSSTNGVDLHDLSKAAPFAPSATGLKNMDDLATSLPFQSRASNKVDLDNMRTSKLRELNLPRPPKPITPPADDKLTHENITQYFRNMTVYMHGWNIFNNRMIDHFRSRQEQVGNGMNKNWISMLGDGPDPDQVTLSDPTNGTLKAGYATYVSWLMDDAKCREWWSHANEIHRQCLEDLGHVREQVKAEATGNAVPV